MALQQTIRTAVHWSGIGVHSGAPSAVTLRPAAEDTGIVFFRTDHGGRHAIPARVANVSDTLLATTLAVDGEQVSTVEHLLSALWGLGIDNVVVEVDGPEVPILDGSAAPFVTALRRAGTRSVGRPRRYIRVMEPVEVCEGDAWAALSPCAGFRASYTFVADHPVYNRYPKHASVDFEEADYLADVGRARSFGLVGELPRAQAMGRCLGSSLENAIGIDEARVLNPEGLRCRDEFVRHKILDAIGDLYLLGMPVLGAFEGHKSGHALNCRLAKTLLERPAAFEVVLDPMLRAAVRSRDVRVPALLAADGTLG